MVLNRFIPWFEYPRRRKYMRCPGGRFGFGESNGSGIQTSKFYCHIRHLKGKAGEITERDKDPHLSAQSQEMVQFSFEEPQENCIPEVTSAQMEAVVWMNFHGIQLEISNHVEREIIANAIAVLQSLC